MLFWYQFDEEGGYICSNHTFLEIAESAMCEEFSLRWRDLLLIIFPFPTLAFREGLGILGKGVLKQGCVKKAVAFWVGVWFYRLL